MIEIVTVVVAMVVVGVWIALPLRRGSRIEPASGPDRRRAEAEAATRSALSGIVDIEEERSIGKLGDADFDVLRRQYEAQALAALRELDAINQAPDDLEAEIAAMRERLACPECGAIRGTAKVCERCGAR